MNLPKLPDSQEPIIGYRGWRYSQRSTHLASLTRMVDWPTTRHSARCVETFWEDIGVGTLHPSPDKHCTCGIYAYRTMEPVITSRERTLQYNRMIVDASGQYSTPMLVYGTVNLWGRIFEHKDGYRAEHASLGELFLRDDLDLPFHVMDNAAQKLQSRYGVPVRITGVAGVSVV